MEEACDIRIANHDLEETVLRVDAYCRQLELGHDAAPTLDAFAARHEL